MGNGLQNAAPFPVKGWMGRDATRCSLTPTVYGFPEVNWPRLAGGVLVRLSQGKQEVFLWLHPTDTNLI